MGESSILWFRLSILWNDSRCRISTRISVSYISRLEYQDKGFRGLVDDSHKRRSSSSTVSSSRIVVPKTGGNQTFSFQPFKAKGIFTINEVKCENVLGRLGSYFTFCRRLITSFLFLFLTLPLRRFLSMHLSYLNSLTLIDYPALSGFCYYCPTSILPLLFDSSSTFRDFPPTHSTKSLYLPVHLYSRLT